MASKNQEPTRGAQTDRGIGSVSPASHRILVAYPVLSNAMIYIGTKHWIVSVWPS